MKTLQILINTSSGINLSARLDMPDEHYKATALFAHCFTCGKDILAASRISRRLLQLGYAVLRFDFAGIGASDGDFSETNFSTNINDVIDAVVWLKSNYQAPELIIGHSLGGTAILAAASAIPEAKGFVVIGSPSDPIHILKLIDKPSLGEIEKNGVADVNLEGRMFRVKKQFLDDVAKQNVLIEVSKIQKPLLIMHSPEDKTVPIEHATNIFRAATHPKSFVSLGNADHLITSKIDAEFIADIVASWSNRYIH